MYKGGNMLRKMKLMLWSLKEVIFGVILVIISLFLYYSSLTVESTIVQLFLLIGIIGLVIIVMRIIRPKDW